MTRDQLDAVLGPYFERLRGAIACIGTQAAGLESDPQIICINGTPAIQWVVKDNGQPNGTVHYTDTNGTVIPAPAPGTFTLGPCSSTEDNTVIRSRCLCDDVNGDGSLIIQYTQFYTYNATTNTITVTGNWLEDLSATYTPVNPVDCDTIGQPGRVVQVRIDLQGAQVWNRPDNVQSMTVKVRRTGDVMNLPTVTDNFGNITPLFSGDVETWSVLDTNALVLTGPMTITTTNANDYITILLTQIV